MVTSFSRVDADDVSFTTHALIEVHATSVRHCALECIRHETCVTFTFMTSQGRCRGHNDVMSSADSRVSSPSARSFVFAKALQCSQMDGGYSLQAGHCVRPFNVTISSDDAEQTCVQHGGGHLIHLKTAEELQLLECITEKMGWENKNIWVGANDKQVEWEFRWSDGTLLSANSAVSWRRGQPNDPPGQEKCVSVHPDKNLTDKPCDDSVRILPVFVCQIDM
ncbi:hypothetical protein V1264_020887 [Littorina saxatilis]